MTRKKAFACGFLSGVPEPLAGALTLVLVSQITAALPYLAAFAAGAMFAVVVKELVPASVSARAVCRNARSRGGVRGDDGA